MIDEHATPYEAPEVEEIDTDHMPVNAIPGQSNPTGAG
jgi:hypothetical protein